MSKFWARLVLSLTAVTLAALVLSFWGCGRKHSQDINLAPAEPDQAQQPSSEEAKPPPNVAATGTRVVDPADSPQGLEAEGKVIEITESTFVQEVLQAETPVVVEFWATYCMPCYILRPILEDLAKEYTGKMKFGAVDIQSNAWLANQLGVTYIPLVVVFENGQETQRFGFAGEQQLREIVAEINASAD